jgi:hypothetical protein
MKNKCFKSSKLSEARFRQLVKCFTLDLTATQTCQMMGLSSNSVNLLLPGEIESDESYLGLMRVRGKRGRVAGKKTIVFGLLKRNDNV